MNEQNHTPEPWAAYSDGKVGWNNIMHFINSLVGELVSYGHISREDARRIVVRVNACAGIPTDVLEKGRVSPNAFRLEESRADKAERQRDLTGHGALLSKLWRVDKIASELQDTCHNQAQRIAELEKDAARYNWLIQKEAWEPSRETLPKWYGGKIKWLGGAYSMNEINDIIDAAMKGGAA